MAKVINGNDILEVDDKDVDVEIPHANSFVSTHVNLIPIQNAVQSTRLFYGSRFFDQALPLTNREAPLVQNLVDEDEKGRSFDDILGAQAGAVYAREPGVVKKVDEDSIIYTTESGDEKKIPLYNNFIFNRKSKITHTPKLKVGDKFDKDSLMAVSNFTDNDGTLSLGLNARVGVVPYKGFSMEDAIVVSRKFADRMKSQQTYQYNQDFDQDTRGGRDHYRSLFPTTFKEVQLKGIDNEGVVKPGTILNEGDPIVLATRPRVLSSSQAQVGKLSKVMRQARADASQIWDHSSPGKVLDVVRSKNGVRVVVDTESPSDIGDKIVFRAGGKGTISKIIDDDKMPRTLDGQPLEVLLNPLSLPSRVNPSASVELALGKVARKLGRPIKLPGFNKGSEKWYEYAENLLKEHGLSDKEQIYDPELDKVLENPVQVGDAYMLKLHHTSASKSGSRGTASYDTDQQPVRGGGAGGGSKRLSGLETNAMLSSGAYANLREGATIRGTRSDEFWRSLRSGQQIKPPGSPFVWEKFQALLAGAGVHARNMPGGKMRLGPMTDKELDTRKAIKIRRGELVDPKTLDPVPGGLFDSDLVAGNRWGYIELPFHVPNPAFEDSIMKILGLTKKEFREIMAGRQELKY